MDYQGTFASVAMMNIVRILLSLATHFDWDLLQVDVKNAFLHIEIDEEIYMEVFPNFRESLDKNKMCKLKTLCQIIRSLLLYFLLFVSNKSELITFQSQISRYFDSKVLKLCFLVPRFLVVSYMVKLHTWPIYLFSL